MAKTVASTKVFQRLDLIMVQFSVVLRRCVPGYDKDRLTKLEHGLRNGWVSEVVVYAFDSSHLCHASLSLTVDWQEYGRQMSMGRVTVSVDDRWSNDTAIEIDELVSRFVNFVQQNHFKTECWWTISSSVWNDEKLKNRVWRELNMAKPSTINWATSPEGITLTVPELPELRTRLQRSE